IPARRSALTGPSRVGPAAIRAVFPSGERTRIASPWPTSSTVTTAGAAWLPDHGQDHCPRLAGGAPARPRATRNRAARRIDRSLITTGDLHRDRGGSACPG